MNYLFCAGGSGVRVLEALVHLSALGVGPDQVKILTIDADTGLGNLQLTNQILNSYNGCQQSFGGQLGKEESFFKTKLTLLAEGGGGAAGAWSPVMPNQRFEQVLGYQLLSHDQEDVTDQKGVANQKDVAKQRDVADLFFTPGEREMVMNLGFQSHPAIGAAALSLLPLFEGNAPWTSSDPNRPGIAQQLRADLNQGPVRVMIVGSVFGGTGASTFFPLALWLKKVAGANPVNAIEIGIVALSPYFSFAPDQRGQAGVPHRSQGPDARKFPHATRAAAQFYHHMRTIGQWPFTAMFWLGDDTPVVVPRNIGGPGQRNPPHFLELIAAECCLDFYESRPQGGYCYYSCTSEGPPNSITWKEIPQITPSRSELLKKQAIKFLLCGLMHADFYWPMINGKPGTPPISRGTISWYDKLFVDNHRSLSAEQDKPAMDRFEDFYRRHLVWWDALHHTTPGRVKLLNPTAFDPGPDPTGTPRLHLNNQRMKALTYPDDSVKHGEGQTDFHRFTFDRKRHPQGATPGAGTYLGILAATAEVFVKRYYQGQND